LVFTTARKTVEMHEAIAVPTVAIAFFSAFFGKSLSLTLHQHRPLRLIPRQPHPAPPTSPDPSLSVEIPFHPWLVSAPRDSRGSLAGRTYSTSSGASRHAYFPCPVSTWIVA
jgi:hypothetical protein